MYAACLRIFRLSSKAELLQRVQQPGRKAGMFPIAVELKRKLADNQNENADIGDVLGSGPIPNHDLSDVLATLLQVQRDQALYP